MSLANQSSRMMESNTKQNGNLRDNFKEAKSKGRFAAQDLDQLKEACKIWKINEQ